ncbi:hypothetical protein TNCV_2377411 [Trichonephila clavipes]|nr:hypothetical protein TNCV_2377411 [Trichonephila clavipes]
MPRRKPNGEEIVLENERNQSFVVQLYGSCKSESFIFPNWKVGVERHGRLTNCNRRHRCDVTKRSFVTSAADDFQSLARRVGFQLVSARSDFVRTIGIFCVSNLDSTVKLANSVAKRANSMTKLRRSGSVDFGNPSMSNVLDMAKALCLACKQRSKPKRSFSLFQIKMMWNGNQEFDFRLSVDEIRIFTFLSVIGASPCVNKELNSDAQPPMRTKAYYAHLSIRDHWALRCMSRFPDQVVSLKRIPQCLVPEKAWSIKSLHVKRLMRVKSIEVQNLYIGLVWRAWEIVFGSGVVIFT